MFRKGTSDPDIGGWRVLEPRGCWVIWAVGGATESTSVGLPSRAEEHILMDAQRRERRLEQALQTLGLGVVLLSSGRLVYVNAAAEQLASAGEHVALGATLEALDPIASRRLSRAFAAARHTRPQATSCLLPSTRGGAPVGARVVPLPAGEVLVVLAIPQPWGGAFTTQLRELFGLTQREASVAAAVCEGSSVAELSRERRISDSTVRTHLSRLLHKVGARSQAQLVSRIRALVPPIAR